MYQKFKCLDFSIATVLRKDIRTSLCYKEVKLSKRNREILHKTKEKMFT